MIVYKCTCKLDDRVYIGITKNSLVYRKNHHLYSARKGSRLYFHKELIRIGINNFEWEEIDTAETLNDLFDLEKMYVEKFKSNNEQFGFNKTSGGEFPDPCYGADNGMFGKTHTDEVKDRLRKAKLGLTWEEQFGEEQAKEIKDKLSKSHTGRKNSKETLEKMSKSSYWKGKGYLMRGENNYNFGKKWSEETKNKVRGENNGMYQKGYLLAGENNGMYGKTHTEEACLKMSKKQTKRGNGNYRKIENLEEIIRLFNEYQSIGKVARLLGENYNKIKRELIFEGIIDSTFREKSKLIK